ncbi:MAG: hypothetical protein AAF297_00725 [Planctomycetota bacterium]
MNHYAAPTRTRQAATAALAILGVAAPLASFAQPAGIDPIEIQATAPISARESQTARIANVVLIDRLLNERSARLISLDAGTLVISDDRGRTASVHPREFIAIYAAAPEPGEAPEIASATPASPTAAVLERLAQLPAQPRRLNQPATVIEPEPDAAITGAPEPSPTWALTLTDGQRLLGTPLDTANPDAISFQADRLGTLEVDLERIASLRWQTTKSNALADPTKGPAESTATDEDTVVLANGDRFGGFVLAVDAEGVELERSDGSTTRFTLERVRSVSLANPADPSQRPLVRLTTGEVFAAEPAAAGPDPMPVPCVLVLPDLLTADLEPTPDGPTRTGSPSSESFARSLCLPPADLRSIELPTRVITALATLPPTRVRPSADRRRTDPPIVEAEGKSRLAQSLVLPGPMTLAWSLPPAANAIVFDARLGGTLTAPDAPPGPWADAVLRITVRTARGRTVLAEHRLWTEDGTARIAETIPDAGEDGRELIIELDSALHGPIQDRVLLLQPLLLAN